MSCPFKPGDRVQKISESPSSIRPPQYTQLPIGHCGTVLDEKPSNFGYDFVVNADGFGVGDARSKYWRRIDGPTSQSAASFLQSLSKPKVTA